ncbi:MAG TPA: MarR family transcriptional regulator [Actinomycetota bacterium]
MAQDIGPRPRAVQQLMRRSRRDWGASRAIVGVLRADSKAAQALERALAEVDLTLPQFNILMVLAASPTASLPLFELNAQLVSTPPNTTWLTNRMEERGFVTKRRDEGDRRVVLLELTESGWRTLGVAAPVVFAAEKGLLSGFNAEEITTLGNLLTRLVR